MSVHLELRFSFPDFSFRKSTLFYGTFLALTGVGLQVGAKYCDVFEMMIGGRLMCGINAGNCRLQIRTGPYKPGRQTT